MSLCIATISSSGDFQLVVGGEVFMFEAQVFLFHNTCGVMCSLLVFLSISFSLLYCYACVM